MCVVEGVEGVLLGTEAMHAGRQTVMPNDMRLSRRIRGEITLAPPMPKMMR